LWASDIHEALSWTFFKEQYLGLFFALALANVFISIKARASAPDYHIPWYDWLMAAASLLVGGYVTVMYPAIAYRLGVLSVERWLLGGLAVVLILEATRRVVGWALVWIAAAFILYAKFAYLFPGMLNAKGSSWPRIATYLYLDSNGIFGLPLDVAARVVVAFILFGQALYAVGGTNSSPILPLSSWAGIGAAPPKSRSSPPASSGRYPAAPSPTSSWTAPLPSR
jgi:TRAP-type uncharacterized transport system fused permease subunit